MIDGKCVFPFSQILFSLNKFPFSFVAVNLNRTKFLAIFLLAFFSFSALIASLLIPVFWMMKKIQLHFFLLTLRWFAVFRLASYQPRIALKWKHFFSPGERWADWNGYKHVSIFSLVFFNVRFGYAPHLIPFMEDHSCKRDRMKLFFKIKRLRLYFKKS